MNRVFYLCAIVIIALSFVLPCSAAEWYVDADNDGGTENGTSWTTAWGKLTDINWASINPGDTIYISGGTASKTYTNQTLTPGASGSAGGGYITIKPGQASPHNGTVVIDKDYNNYYGISISNQDYIRISGQVGSGVDCKIKVTHANYNGIHITGSSDHIILEYIEVTDNGFLTSAKGGIDTDGTMVVDMLEVAYSKFHDNRDVEMFLGMSNAQNSFTNYGAIKIHHNEFYNFSSDGINGYADGVDIYNNTFHDRMTIKDDYTDFIQYFGSYFRYYNNISYNLARDNSTSQPAAWQASTTYRYGDLVSETGTNAPKYFYVQKTTGSCTTGESEPAWDRTYANSTSDGTCSWKSKMYLANDDNTYWPSDWAVNAHMKYSPGAPSNTTPDHIWFFNNLVYETTTSRCLTKGCTSARAFELSLHSESSLTSVDSIYVLNNTIAGIPLNAVSTGCYPVTANCGNMYIVNNLIKNAGGAIGANATPLETSKDSTNSTTIGDWGDTVDITVDYNLCYADTGYSCKWVVDATGYTWAEYQALENTPNSHGVGPSTDPSLGITYKPTTALAGVSLSSFCTETAALCTDLDGISRSVWNVGAYEYVPLPTYLPWRIP